MILLDANYILRYLINEDEQMHTQARETIEHEACFVAGEVLAEVVYVLHGYYEVSRPDIASALALFLERDTLQMHEPKMLVLEALQLFASTKLDYVDCLLCALGSKYEIKSFDKGVNRCLSSR